MCIMVSADPEWSKALTQTEYTKEQENNLWILLPTSIMLISVLLDNKI